LDRGIAPRNFLRSVAVNIAYRGVPTLSFAKTPAADKGLTDSPQTYHNILDALLSHPTVCSFADFRPIVLMGHSFGGHVAPYLANRARHRIDGIVLVNSNFSQLADTLIWQQETAFGFMPEHVRLNLRRAAENLRMDYNLDAELRQLRCPVLHITCNADDQIPRHEAGLWRIHLEQSRCSYSSIVYERLDHLCSSGERDKEVDSRFLDDVTVFMRGIASRPTMMGISK
jgi:acetyl esterase/lipase